MKPIIVNNIFKNYGKVEALHDISLTVENNELFGLIGPDGAGKTTLIRILATLLLADKGNATLYSHDVVKDYKAIRNSIGYMPGRFSLYKDLTVEENLEFFASVFGSSIEENYELISDIYCQLEPFKKRRAEKLSGGMKQKLALCCTLIHRPTVLLLDEPTTGVDPVSRHEFWDMLHTLREKNITIFVSTPYMDEAEMCDRVALINNGKIISVDTPQNIVDSYNAQLWAIEGENKYRLLLDCRNYAETKKCYPFGETLHLIFNNSNPDLNSFRNYLIAHNHKDIHINKIKPNIEDCYMNLSNKA